MSKINKVVVKGVSYDIEDAYARKKIDSELPLNIIKADVADMNYIVQTGIYNIDNKLIYDNSPITNQGAISARLTVLVTESGGNKVITQVINLNNNEGGEGNVYIRSCQNGEWKAWGKLQTNVEVGQINTLDNLTDNGIYSGVFTDGTPTSAGTFYDTFVLIVINNYAVSIPTGYPQSISQLKYSLGLDGSISVASRKRDQYGYWDNWASLDEKSLVEEEKSRAEQAEQDIKDKAVEADSLNFLSRANEVALDYKTIKGVGDEITIPAATTEKAGVMSANDKEVVTSLCTIDYQDNPYKVGIWQEQDGKVEEGTSSVYARYNPIPVHSGQKIVYSADPGNNKALYITDKDGFVIYTASYNNGEIYAPDKAAFVYITSTTWRYSCVVYGVYDTYSYRIQKLDKLFGESITFPLNGYYTSTGAWQEDSSWYCTEKIAVSENSGVETNALLIACWDINGTWLGRNAGKDGILEGTKYIAASAKNDGFYLHFNSYYCNIPTQEDINILTRSVASFTERTSVDVEMLSNVELVGNDVAVIEGVAGEVGAKYSVPITVKGGYGITMKFKMPNDLHTAVYERELISFGTRASATTNGFSVDIKSVLPTNDLSQISCKSTLGFYPTNSKTNNYAGSLSVGSTNRPFVGEAAFSIRYTGSLEGNADIAYTLGEDALRVYHTDTDADVLNILYPEDGLITSLLDAINAHTGTLEAVGYAAENLTLDNIIKCSAIPLAGNYDGTVDAFPSFVLLKDDDWHTLEVRFDASKGKGLDMIAGYIDGYRFYHNDSSYKVYGNGYFESNLLFGCEGVVVKSIKVAPTLKSKIPNIVALCQHGINGDEKFNSTVTSSGNLSVTYGHTEEILRTFKKYGFKYVTSEQIHSYLKHGESLPHNSFTIIHDDYFYVHENTNSEYARDVRKLYLRNGIKAAFAIIPQYLTEETNAACLKDKDVFEFLIHDDYNLRSKQGYQAIADRINNVIFNFKSKLFTSNVWVYAGGEYDANTKMMLHAAGISMAYYTSGITTSGGISPMKDTMVLPRLYMNDTSPNTISKLEKILSSLIRH